MYESLNINIKTFYDGLFQFYQTGLLRKVREATGMDRCKGSPIPTKVESPLVIDNNSSEAKRDCPNSYASVIVMMLYLVSNKRPDISFDVHQCAKFTNKTKA